MLRILHDTKFDFIRHWRTTTAVIALFLVPALIWIAIAGFRYSIEFTGGTLMQLQFQQPLSQMWSPEHPDVHFVHWALQSTM